MLLRRLRLFRHAILLAACTPSAVLLSIATPARADEEQPANNEDDDEDAGVVDDEGDGSGATPVADSVHKSWLEGGYTLSLRDTDEHIPTPDTLRALKEAARTWNDFGAGPRIEIERTHDDPGTDPVALDGKNTVGFPPDGDWPYPVNAGAVTVTWMRAADNSIIETDTALNPTFAFTLDVDNDRGSFDLQNILTHELGHSLGLPDIKDPREATMFYLVLPRETLKRDLADTDERLLMGLYDGEFDDGRGGCSATGVDPALLSALPLLAVVRRRRRSSRA